MRANLPMATWGYEIFHVGVLIHIKPTSYHKYSYTVSFWLVT